MSTRRRLPNRRASISFNFECAGLAHTLGEALDRLSTLYVVGEGGEQ
jgi:hypothetical protein